MHCHLFSFTGCIHSLAHPPVSNGSILPSWSGALARRAQHQRLENFRGTMSSMAREILAFILTTSGWVLVSSTLPTDYWKVSSIDGTVITTATFWSNLWKTCVTDSTGVSNCKDFPSMLALDGQTLLSSLCANIYTVAVKSVVRPIFTLY